jgi:hypothetical protein
MNIKRIIREEIDDFNWMIETNPFSTLDSHFGITKSPEGFKFEGLDKNKAPEGESLGRFIFPWTWNHNKHLRDIAVTPAKLFDKVYKATDNELFKVIYGKSMYNLNYFKNKKLIKSFKDWKSSRIEGLKDYYPMMWKYYINHLRNPN